MSWSGSVVLKPGTTEECFRQAGKEEGEDIYCTIRANTVGKYINLFIVPLATD